MQTLTTPDTTQQKLDASFGVALQRLAERQAARPVTTELYHVRHLCACGANISHSQGAFDAHKFHGGFTDIPVNTGAEVDGDDSHPNEPDPMPAPCSYCDGDGTITREYYGGRGGVKTTRCPKCNPLTQQEKDPAESEFPFDWHTAYTSPEFDSLEHPQPRIIEWTDGKDERPAHITLADWDAPFNGNQWEPGQVRGQNG